MTTLTTHVTRYIDHRRAAGEFTHETAVTVRGILGRLDQLHGDRPLNQFGPATMERWTESVANHAASTRCLYRAHVRSFCRWATNEHIIDRDPSVHLRPIPQPRRAPVTFTETELAQVLATAEDPRASAILHLMAQDGARCVEVSRLRVDDYDPQGRTIRLTGKGGHERVLPVPSSTAKALDAYLETVGRVAGPFFRSEVHPNRGLGAKTISIYVRRWITDAGVKVRAWDGRSGHGLRRTAASNLMDQCGNIRITQEFLGHADVSTTAQFYLRRASMEQMRDALEQAQPPAAA